MQAKPNWANASRRPRSYCLTRAMTLRYFLDILISCPKRRAYYVQNSKFVGHQSSLDWLKLRKDRTHSDISERTLRGVDNCTL